MRKLFVVQDQGDGSRANNSILFIGLFLFLIGFSLVEAFIAVNYSPLFAVLLLFSIPIAIVLLRSPEVGLILIVALIPFENINILTISDISFFEVFTLFVYSIALVYALVNRKNGELVRTKANWLLFLFLLTVILSTLVAFDHERSINGTFRLLRNISLYLFAINLVRSKRTFYFLLWSLVFTGTLSALYGLYGYYFDQTLLDASDKVLRVQGTMNDPNEFAGAMIVRLMIAVGLFRIVSNRVQQILLIIFVIIITYSIFLSGSRGGVLGVSAAALSYTFTGKVNFRWLIVASFTILVGLILMPQSLKERVGLVETSDNVGNNLDRRITYLYLGQEIIKKYPVLGLGIDGFAPYYAQSEYRFMASSSSGRIAHNTYLEIATGTGLVGLTMFLILILYVYTKAWRMSRININSDLAKISGGLFAGLTGFFIVAFFLSQQYEKTLWLLIGIVVIIEQLNLKNTANVIHAHA